MSGSGLAVSGRSGASWTSWNSVSSLRSMAEYPFVGGLAPAEVEVGGAGPLSSSEAGRAELSGECFELLVALAPEVQLVAPAGVSTDTDTAVGEPCRALELNRGHVLTGEYQLIGRLEHRSCCLSSLLPGLTSALLLGLFLRDVVVHVHVGRTDERRSEERRVGHECRSRGGAGSV